MDKQYWKQYFDAETVAQAETLRQGVYIRNPAAGGVYCFDRGADSHGCLRTARPQCTRVDL